MKLRKALSIILAVCMVLSSVSVAYAGEIPEITETEIVGVEETVTEDQEVEIKTESIEEVEEAITENQEVEAKAESAEEKSETEEANAEGEGSKGEDETEDSNKETEGIVLTAEHEDVIVTLKADADAFDNKGELSLKVTPAEIAESEEEALDAAEKENVAKRVTYDITVYDDGEEIEPVKEVKVLFDFKDAPSGADGVNIYHHVGTSVEDVKTVPLKTDAKEETVSIGEAETVTAEEKAADKNIEIKEVDEEELADTDGVELEYDITITTDSFSLYTVDFTYKDKTISIAGDTTGNKLDDIVSQLGITEKVEEAETYQTADCTGEDTDGEIKNAEGETLFTVYESGDTWYVDAENAFQTEHGLVIKTADGAEYKIKVTDDVHDSQDCITFSSDAPFTLSATLPSGVELYYSTNTTSWVDWSGSPINATQNAGTGSYNLYLYGTSANTKISAGSAWNLTPTTGHTISCTGNIETLRGATGDNPSDEPMGLYCYDSMFQGCTSLTTAPELLATTLATQCYNNMFKDCTSLIKAPELPATTLAEQCYYEMFSGCTSLIKAPTLPATTLAYGCYNGMFKNCINLITAPALPATTLETACYAYMFFSCTALKTAPELPATNLATFCYGHMFEDCTNLITAPLLPTNPIADSCYNSMFYDCTNLEVYDPTTVDSTYALWITTDTDPYGKYCDMLENVSLVGGTTKYTNHPYYVKIRTITFDTNGHGTAPASQGVKSGGKVIKPADLTAEGYTFGGWYKESGCTNAWDFDNDIVTADTTLYAKWTQNSTPAPTSSGSSGGSSSYTTGWHPSGTNWQYVKPDGSFAKNEWIQIELDGEKKWYHFGNDTMMDTGWFRDTDGTWYYLNKENNKYIGTMYLGWLTDPQDGYRYYLDPANGKMHTGWHVVDGKKHYFCEGSATASGWTQDANLEWVYDKRNVIPLGAMIQ